MGAGRRTETIHGGTHPSSHLTPISDFRHLPPENLHSVIFGCTNSTFRECVDNLIFGLPFHHICYVDKVKPGMPLFLFNYSDRKLHGVFEATSSGRLNINPCGWTLTGKTSFPAQVRVKIIQLYRPLQEKVFKAAISENYYNELHFYFELDKIQTQYLLDLMKKSGSDNCRARKVDRPIKIFNSQKEANEDSWLNPKVVEGWHNAVPFVPPTIERNLFVQSESSLLQNSSSFAFGNSNDFPLESTIPVSEEEESRQRNKVEQETMYLGRSSDTSSDSVLSSPSAKENKQQNVNEEDNRVSKTLKQQLFEQAATSPVLSTGHMVGYTENNAEEHGRTGLPMMDPLTHVELLKDLDQLRKRNALLEHNHNQMALELQCLKQEISRISFKLGYPVENETSVEVRPNLKSGFRVKEPDTHEVYLLGGHDGQSWLGTVDVFVPSTYEVVPAAPMLSPRSCAAAAVAIGHIFVFGGGNGKLWYETAETYNFWTSEWHPCPAMNKKRGCLAGATVGDHIFALGGGNGQLSFSDVEYYDIHRGEWILCTPMQCKRFGLAAAEVDGALYALGGFDERLYLVSVERYDSREGVWTSMSPMNRKRGSLSSAVLDGKIFAIGGFDGANFLNSVEVYEPRRNCWLELERGMQLKRAYGTAAVVGENIYAFGGTDGSQTIDVVEQYSARTGWQVVASAKIGRRSFLTAAVV